VVEQLAHGRRPVDGLSRGQQAARDQRVAPAQLERRQPDRGGQPVHLRLVAEADLDGAESAHGPHGGLFVKTTRASNAACGTAYGPARNDAATITTGIDVEA
jgi:hypothetical protein